MPATRVTLLAIPLLCVPTIGWAQVDRWTPEGSVAVGLAHVFRFDDETFGDRPTAGVAVAIAHRSGWVIELAADRVFDLEPKPAPCGLVDNTCVGDGRYGPRAAAVASLGIHYRFSGKRLQPFVFAGVGVLWTTSVHTTTYARTNPAVMVESESRDRGVGPDVGAGLRLVVSRRLAISPEVRWLDASVLSRENLAVTRIGVRMAYIW